MWSEADENFLRRAIRLAMNGRGHVEPNPMVGCVLVKDGRVIGEGYHAGYGKPHALHGQGEFRIDLDVAKSLDPFAHQADSGSVRVSYELPHDFLDNPNFLPRSITARFPCGKIRGRFPVMPPPVICAAPLIENFSKSRRASLA